MPRNSREDPSLTPRQLHVRQDMADIEARFLQAQAQARLENEDALRKLQARLEGEIAAIHSAIQRIENELASSEWQLRTLIAAKLIELNVRSEAAYEQLRSASPASDSVSANPSTASPGAPKQPARHRRASHAAPKKRTKQSPET